MGRKCLLKVFMPLAAGQDLRQVLCHDIAEAEFRAIRQAVTGINITVAFHAEVSVARPAEAAVPAVAPQGAAYVVIDFPYDYRSLSLLLPQSRDLLNRFGILVVGQPEFARLLWVSEINAPLIHAQAIAQVGKGFPQMGKVHPGHYLNDTEPHIVLSQSISAALNRLVASATPVIFPAGIMNGFRPIHTDADAELVLFEELCPVIRDERSVRLDVILNVVTSTRVPSLELHNGFKKADPRK
jgi:hypothetical protein